MKHLAIIPARSGSKGLKDKNVKILNGKPMMVYTIEAACKANIFDCVHVSTDSQEYAEIARENGADTPFLRSKEYSTDTANTWDVVRYVLKKYAELGKQFDMVTVLQPTSPLRTVDDICGAYKRFCEKKASAVVSVSEMEHSPVLCNKLEMDLSLNNFVDMSLAKRRQNMPRYYRVNGGIYMIKVQILDALDELYGANSYAYIMKRENSIDIDDDLDFKIAEALLTNKVD